MEQLPICNSKKSHGYTLHGYANGFLYSLSKNRFVCGEHDCLDTLCSEYDFNMKLIGRRIDGRSANIILIHKVNNTCSDNVIPVSRNRYTNEKEFSDIFNKMSIENKGYYPEYDEWEFAEYTLIRYCDTTTTFIISTENNTKIIMMACLDNASYRDGDAGTTVFLLDGKNILLWNNGDCPSLLFIKNLNKNAKPILPISSNMMKAAREVKLCRDNIKKAIGHLIFAMIESKYNILESECSNEIIVNYKVGSEIIMICKIIYTLDCIIICNCKKFYETKLFSLNDIDNVNTIKDISNYIRYISNQ